MKKNENRIFWNTYYEATDDDLCGRAILSMSKRWMIQSPSTSNNNGNYSGFKAKKNKHKINLGQRYHHIIIIIVFKGLCMINLNRMCVCVWLGDKKNWNKKRTKVEYHQSYHHQLHTFGILLLYRLHTLYLYL